jgi:hypothetical protein
MTKMPMPLTDLRRLLPDLAEWADRFDPAAQPWMNRSGDRTTFGVDVRRHGRTWSIEVMETASGRGAVQLTEGWPRRDWAIFLYAMYSVKTIAALDAAINGGAAIRDRSMMSRAEAYGI